MVSSVFPPVHFPLQMFATPHKPINDYAYDHLNIYRFRHTPMNYSFHQHHRQSSPLKVIQLVEVPAPSKPERVAPPPSSSASSSTSESSSEDEPCTSYCSSDDDELPQQRAQFQPQMPQYQQRRYAESENVDRNMSTLMLRIEAWRDEYAKAVGAQFAPSPLRTKRKGAEDDGDNEDDDDTHSRSSKRSRQPSVRSVHSCSACDASFASRQSLRRHGRGVRTNEACRAAVEYGFE